MKYFLLANTKLFENFPDAVMISLIAGISAVLMIFVGYRLLQMLQLTGYKLRGYNRWFRETKCSYLSRLVMLSFLSVCSILITNVLLVDFFVIRPLYYVGAIFFILFCSLFITNLFTAKQKTPLKYTKRMTRLVIVYTIIVLALSWALAYVGYRYVPYLSYGLVAIIPMLLPVVVFLAYFITYPVEKLISSSYIKKAKKKLNSKENLLIIGITGSYGKTSVKNILGTILSEKYKVCATPSSYNTPLGLSKTILSNLKDEDEVFIAEMGAKQRYDIRELCEMVNPEIGMITGIGNQHLLTFGSVETIAKTKGELADFISKKGGKLYINTEKEETKKLAKEYSNCIRIEIDGKDCDIEACGIKTTKDGSTFELVYGEQKVKCKTLLLGDHNISNILLASRVAIDLGLSLEEIARGIEKLVTIPHRLEIVKSSSTYTILDDAYNSSVEGSKASLNVLSKFDGQKFVITPGLVELGSEQFNSNFEFGRNLAQVCDYVIIDSVINYDAISSGMIFAGFDENKIIQVGNLKQAVEMLSTLAKPNDVVLFENDLPDNYS